MGKCSTVTGDSLHLAQQVWCIDLGLTWALSTQHTFLYSSMCISALQLGSPKWIKLCQLDSLVQYMEGRIGAFFFCCFTWQVRLQVAEDTVQLSPQYLWSIGFRNPLSVPKPVDTQVSNIKWVIFAYNLPSPPVHLKSSLNYL